MSPYTLVPSRYHNTCFVHVYVQTAKHITDPGAQPNTFQLTFEILQIKINF